MYRYPPKTIVKIILFSLVSLIISFIIACIPKSDNERIASLHETMIMGFIGIGVVILSLILSHIWVYQTLKKYNKWCNGIGFDFSKHFDCYCRLINPMDNIVKPSHYISDWRKDVKNDIAKSELVNNDSILAIQIKQDILKESDCLKAILIPGILTIISPLCTSNLLNELETAFAIIIVALFFMIATGITINAYNDMISFWDNVLESIREKKNNIYNQHIPHEYSNVFTQKAEK